LLKRATDAAEKMGDIFFDPDPTQGETVIPVHVAINRIVDAMIQFCTHHGIQVVDNLADLPEHD
jgi:hypothetical protein